MIGIAIVIEITEVVDSVIEGRRLQDLVMDTPTTFVVTFMDEVVPEVTMVHQEDDEVLMENLHQIGMDHQAVDRLHRVVENVAVVMRVPQESHSWSEMWLLR